MFIQENDKGEEVVKALNGHQLDGRSLKVDVANSGKSGGGGQRNKGRNAGSGDDNGKSSRELQALREEAEDGKKRHRRRRPKKD